jgi:hypothetical protein
MTFYAKPINRPLALEGWFEKPTNRLFGHVRVKRNPNTIPVSKIICTCTTIFLKFYNKCVNKNESGHHSSTGG